MTTPPAAEMVATWRAPAPNTQRFDFCASDTWRLIANDSAVAESAASAFGEAWLDHASRSLALVGLLRLAKPPASGWIAVPLDAAEAFCYALFQRTIEMLRVDQTTPPLSVAWEIHVRMLSEMIDPDGFCSFRLRQWIVAPVSTSSAADQSSVGEPDPALAISSDPRGEKHRLPVPCFDDIQYTLERSRDSVPLETIADLPPSIGKMWDRLRQSALPTLLGFIKLSRSVPAVLIVAGSSWVLAHPLEAVAGSPARLPVVLTVAVKMLPPVPSSGPQLAPPVAQPTRGPGSATRGDARSGERSGREPTPGSAPPGPGGDSNDGSRGSTLSPGGSTLSVSDGEARDGTISPGGGGPADDNRAGRGMTFSPGGSGPGGGNGSTGASSQLAARAGGRLVSFDKVFSSYWHDLRRDTCQASYRVGAFIVYKTGVVEGPAGATPEDASAAVAEASARCSAAQP